MKSPVVIISLSEYFGFDPNSPYADLFSNIYHLTKPRTDVDENIDEEEDGEIIENDDETCHGGNKVKELDNIIPQLSDNRDYQSCPDLSDEDISSKSVEKQKASENWNEGWMKISREAISWSQTSNQNLVCNSWVKQIEETPPAAPPQFSQLPALSQSGASIFQGTNQINSSIFSNGVCDVADGQTSFPQAPPSWCQPPFFRPFNSNNLSTQGASLLGVPNFLPPNVYVGRNNFQGSDNLDGESKGFDLRILFDLDDNPLRRHWLLAYMNFQASKGTPLISCPAFHKEPLDLFKLFNAVMEEGGFANCSAKKAWKKVYMKMDSRNREPQLWRLCQKQYRKFLLHFENYQVGRPEDLSVNKAEKLDGVDYTKRKVLLPSPPINQASMNLGSSAVQWGALSAIYSMNEPQPTVGFRGLGGKKAKKSTGKRF